MVAIFRSERSIKVADAQTRTLGLTGERQTSPPRGAREAGNRSVRGTAAQDLEKLRERAPAPARALEQNGEWRLATLAGAVLMSPAGGETALYMTQGASHQ